MKSIYLDYAATTPLDPVVLKAMTPYLTTEYGNPGSMHSFGQRASAAIFNARQAIAEAIGVHYSEIIFTGSATEANNLILKSFPKSSVVISSIEHDSVFKSAPKAVQIPVSKSGFVNLIELEKSINSATALVSIIYANNETGVIQDIERISKIIKKKNPNTLFHVDAVQAFQYLNCKPKELGVDFMTISAHKIYGPKGIGLLYASKSAQKKLIPIITGGGQENGLRSGTENTASIVGFAKAIELTEKNRELENKRISALRDYLWTEIKKVHPKAQLNGDINKTLPNILNFYFPNLSAEEALVAFDLAGIAISAGPACSSRSLDPSRTLLAMGSAPDRAKNSLRISLGKPTKKQDIDSIISEFKKLTQK